MIIFRHGKTGDKEFVIHHIDSFAGEKYLVLSQIIPMLSILHEKTLAFSKNPGNYGTAFAKRLLALLEDRFGKYPDFLLLLPYAIATFSDPRFGWIYFKSGPQMDYVHDKIISIISKELEIMEVADSEDLSPAVVQPKDDFWGDFDDNASGRQEKSDISAELRLWK